jgi:transcriptional regulator with XRE-family HTH domain
MDEKEWSERRLAAKSGVAQKTINKILNLESAPTSDTIDKLAAAFGLAAWQLTLPIPPEQISDSGSFSALLHHYIAASPDSRAEISRVAEREAKHRK